MGRTSIEWTDYSWPIVNGCRRVSEGCRHCYAERLEATRLSRQPKYAGLAVYGRNGPRWTGETRLWPAHLGQPLRIARPARVFVADMGDLFYEGVDEADIRAVFGVMYLCGHLTFQLLTKRSARMRDFMLWLASLPAEEAMERCFAAAMDRGLDRFVTPSESARTRKAMLAMGRDPEAVTVTPPGLWLGVSVEDRTSLGRLDDLRATPAAVRYASLEPLLEDLGVVDLAGIRWCVIGGESGPGARECRLSWVRSLVAQAEAAGSAPFVKQLGSRPYDDGPDAPDAVRSGWLRLGDRKGGEMAEWPADLRIRRFPDDPPPPSAAPPPGAGPASLTPAARPAS